MAHVARKKATIGFSTFVKTLGLHVRPNGKASHCKSSPNQTNLRYFLDDSCIPICGYASFKSKPVQKEPSRIHSHTDAKVSIINLYFLTHLLKFKFKIGLNLPGDLGLVLSHALFLKVFKSRVYPSKKKVSCPSKIFLKIENMGPKECKNVKILKKKPWHQLSTWGFLS